MPSNARATLVPLATVKSQINATNSNENENYGEVYPVPTNSWKIPVGNSNTRRAKPGTVRYKRQKAMSNKAMYNLFEYPRQRAIINKTLRNARRNAEALWRNQFTMKNQNYLKN